MKKKHPIHLISTDKPSKVGSLIILEELKGNTLILVKKGQVEEINRYSTKSSQFLYITSDEEIKDHEHSIDISTNKLILKTERGYGRLNLRKIIATNNPELWKECTNYITESCKNICLNCSPIPKIDEQWIKDVYIPAYNSGKPITEVEIEYDEHLDGIKYSSKTNTTYTLKLSNGNVIISPIEEKLYTKEQLKSAILTVAAFPQPFSTNDFDKWFNKNYSK